MDMHSSSGIRDNHARGNAGEFLRKKIQPGSKLSFVSAYFTIYAHHALKDQLDSIDRLRFLFGEPRFIQSLDPEKTDRKAFDVEDSQLQLRNRLEQKQVARECAEWIQEKVDIRSVKHPGFLHGKMYHMDQNSEATKFSEEKALSNVWISVLHFSQWLELSGKIISNVWNIYVGVFQGLEDRLDRL